MRITIQRHLILAHALEAVPDGRLLLKPDLEASATDRAFADRIREYA